MKQLNTVVQTSYGPYYRYADDNGKIHKVKLYNDAFEYYQNGYLTDDDLARIVQNKHVTISVAKRSGGNEQFDCYMEKVVSQRGYPYLTIKFEATGDFTDASIIKANSSRIATSYWKAEDVWDYMRPQKIIDDLSLDQKWKTFATHEKVGDYSYGIVKVYTYKPRKASFVLHVRQSKDKVEYVSEDIYQKDVVEAAARREQQKKQQSELLEKIFAVKQEMLSWIQNLSDELFKDGNSKSAIINRAKNIVEDVHVPNLDTIIASRLNVRTTSSFTLNACFNSANQKVHALNSRTYDDNDVLNEIKNDLLKDIKFYVAYNTLTTFRSDLYAELESKGIEELTAGIDIDDALNLGYFPQVQKILVKYKADAPKRIVFDMYREIVDVNELRKRLLNMLKIFHDFYDMPEKDRKAIAKFVAIHNIKEYYDQVSRFDDVFEVLVTNSNDPKLTKPLLESVAGTSRAHTLKDSTYYFEKRARVKGNILLFKPVELLDDLRDSIKEFNVSSNVAVLVNIELDADGSFVFCFYTFANSGDDCGFDGRRIQYMTKLYNAKHPDRKIGFVFDNY